MKTILFLLATGMHFSLFAQANTNDEVYEPVPASVVGELVRSPPPSDAIILFDGSNLNEWITAESELAAEWKIANGAMTVKRGLASIKTRRQFSDVQLHVEWRSTDVIQGSGQSRGNSGIFLHSLYEIQILDSWDNPTYINGQAGSVYLQHSPLVNASKPPGQWQSYDILFTSPTFASDGALLSPAYVTVLHNGVLVLNHVEILGSTFTPTPEYLARCTPYGQERVQACSGKMPITLQDHGQVVSYRNIWVREL